jgi:hypothetical protein
MTAQAESFQAKVKLPQRADRSASLFQQGTADAPKRSKIGVD